MIACGSNMCWLAAANIEQIDPVVGTVTAVVSLPAPVANPGYLLFDGTSFFVVGTSTSAPASPTSWTLERIPPQGGTAVTVATLPASSVAGGFAVDDACVYFTTAAGIYSLSSSAAGVVVPN